MKILAFAGSNSADSINKKLAAYAASLFTGASVQVLDLNDFPLPLFSKEVEKEIGQPEQAARFLSKIVEADFIVLSLAENNANYNVGFKNIFDWCSRINGKPFQDKPMLLMATSPGKRGGSSVLEIAKNAFPRYGADIKATFSLPLFDENFEEGNGIVNEELNNQLQKIIEKITF